MHTTTTPATALMQDTHMIDDWRHLHPTSTACYTCYPASHMFLSEIDHMLVLGDLMPYLPAAAYVSRSVSDHSLGILDVAWGIPCPEAGN